VPECYEATFRDADGRGAVAGNAVLRSGARTLAGTMTALNPLPNRTFDLRWKSN
jgi:hypothetical protein